MLEYILYFNFFDYIYNNIYYYYNIYILLYKFSIYTKFYTQYWLNVLKFYVTLNKITSNVLRFFLLAYNFIKKILLWFNRRFFKKKKRFRIYYKFHNVRYWKFFLFFFYINIFFLLWKRRNLYRKSQFIIILVFAHITILISLHFFLGLFNSYDIGFLTCIFFFYMIALLYKR